VKRLLGLAGAVAALILIVGAPAAYAANTLYVNAATGVDGPSCGAQGSPCQTISQAVANASSGDTIVVAPGTYDESVSIFTSDLTLEGAQTGNPGSAARAAEDPATESVVTGGTILVDADHVTLDGFSFGFAGNQVFTQAASSTIENDVFSGYQPEGCCDSALGGSTAPDAEVVHNYFTSPTAHLFDSGGAVVQWSSPADCSGVDVSDNIFDDASADDLSNIFFFCDGQSGEAPVTVSGNQDIGNNSSFAIFQAMAGPVDVTGNTVSMVTANAGTGMIFDDDPNLGAVHIRGNTLTGSPFRAVKIIVGNDCCGFAGPIDAPFTITGNDFSGNGVGVYVGAGALVSGASVVLRANNLSNESGDGDPATGLYNGANPGATVDAGDNWWGCNAGPNQTGCSTVSGTVADAAWLVLNVSASLSSLQTGARTAVTADLTHDSSGADTSGSGTIPDGSSVAFSTDLGSVSASSAATSLGKAAVNLHSSTAGTAHVTATFDGQSASASVTYTTGPADASQSTLTPLSSSVLADGSSTEALTVRAMNQNGAPLTSGGATVTIAKLSGVGTVGPVTDNGDGTYTATVTAPSSAGTGVFVATLDGDPVKSGGAAQTQASVHFVAPPTITSFSPGSGGDHTTVTVTGTNFTGVTRVRLNGMSASFIVVSATKLTFTVPEGATSGAIAVSNGATTVTSSGTFTVMQPTITSVSPGSGPVGTTVTITGTGLLGTVGVQLGRVLVVPASVTDNQVTFVVPLGATTGVVRVLTRDGAATSPGTFLVIA
jgi:hypothetical protein